MKNIIKKYLRWSRKIIFGTHPFVTIFSYNWLYTRKNVQWIKENIDFFNNSIVVDYGAGNSPYYSLIKEKIKNYYALDFYEQPNIKDKYVAISLIEDGSPPNDFEIKADIVLSNQTLMEVNNLDNYLLCINDFSKPGTILFITAPFFQPLGLNDKYRISPVHINKKLKDMGYNLIKYKTAGHFFVGMSFSFNMLLVMKNRYDIFDPMVSVSLFKTLLLSPFIVFSNLIGLFLDKLFPLYRMPANYLIIAKKE